MLTGRDAASPCPHRHQRQRPASRVHRALAGLFAGALVFLPAAAGAATPDTTPGATTGGTTGGTTNGREADDVLSVAQELSRSVDVGDHVVLRITLAADRLIDGEVRVTNGRSPLVVQQDVQVAGGSSEEFLLVVPVSDPGSATFDVELLDGGRSIDADTVRFTYDAGTDVAGVMPVLLARSGEPPARVTLDGDLRRVDMVAIALDVFDLGPSALSQLDTVLATSDDLVSLGPTARSALLGWLDGGGHLVLDDTDDLTVLPVEWQPTESGYAFAGRGEVRIAEGALTAAEWDGAIAPAPLSAFESPVGNIGLDMFIDPRVTLAQRAGVELPDLDRIVVVLAVYVLLIGPVLYLVLRRLRRLTAAWVAIPVVALLVAGGVVATSQGWNTAARSTGATIVESHAGGSKVSYQQLMARRSGGTASFTVPTGWAALDQGQTGWWGGDVSTPRTVTSSPAGTTVGARLEPGQVAVLEAEGVADGSLLVIDARFGDDLAIRGTVTNTAGVDLASVAVFGGGRGVLVGDLAAGASADYVIEQPFDDPDPFDTPLRTVWNDPEFGLGFDAEPTPEPTPGIDVGIWTWFASRSAAELYPSGLVRAAGWSPQLTAPGDATGAIDNVTLVTTVAPIMNDATTLAPQTVRWTWLETPFDPRTGEPGTPVFRFVVPPGAPTDELVLQLPPGVSGVEVLDSRGRWTELGDTGPDETGPDETGPDEPGPDDTREEAVEVPASMLRDGALIVRATLDMFAGVDPSTAHPLLGGTLP